MLVRNAGGVTNALFNLKKGDSVFIRGPYGTGFPLEEIKGKNIIMIAGGTGIAPITSLINYAEQNLEKFKSIKIYFGFRNEDYILLKDKIDKWKKKFNLIITLDKKSKNKAYSYGFIHKILEKEKLDLKNTLAFICGPEIMMSSCTPRYAIYSYFWFIFLFHPPTTSLALFSLSNLGLIKSYLNTGPSLHT